MYDKNIAKTGRFMVICALVSGLGLAPIILASGCGKTQPKKENINKRKLPPAAAKQEN